MPSSKQYRSEVDVPAFDLIAPPTDRGPTDGWTRPLCDSHQDCKREEGRGYSQVDDSTCNDGDVVSADSRAHPCKNGFPEKQRSTVYEVPDALQKRK